MNQENKMNQEIAIVNGTEIRVIKEGENLLFVAKDIVEGVGAVWASTSLDHIPDDFKLVRSVLTSFGTKPTHVLTEAGLNMYLFRSDKPAALPFQRKLAEEILPSIRKHGMYATAPTIEAMLNDPDVMIKTLTALKEERIAKVNAQLEAKEAQKALAVESAVKEQVQAEKAQVEKKLTVLGTAVHDIMHEPEGTLTIRDTAKMLASRDWNVRETELRVSLQKIGWLTQGKGATATAYAIQHGYMTAGGVVTNHVTGWSGEARTPKLTGKGFVKVAAAMEKLGYKRMSAMEEFRCALDEFM